MGFKWCALMLFGIFVTCATCAFVPSETGEASDTGAAEDKTSSFSGSGEGDSLPLHQHRKRLLDDNEQDEPKLKKGDIPAPDIRTLKDFIEQAKDYGDGSSETSFFDGPTKTCKRKKAQFKAQGDDVEIMVAYPHPLSEEDKAKMESLSRAYWSAVGMDVPHHHHQDRVVSEEQSSTGWEEEDGKVFFEKVIEETEEKVVENID